MLTSRLTAFSSHERRPGNAGSHAAASGGFLPPVGGERSPRPGL